MVVRGAPARRGGRRSFSVPGVLLALALIATPASAADRPAADNPVGVHSMLYLNTPFSAKQAMFKEAAAIGASEIRLDLELSGVFVNPDGPPDWSGVDQYMLLARQYHLRVLADLTATPWYNVACPPGTPPGFAYWTCPPSDSRLWGRQAGEIAAHTRGVINDFEIINEPDGSWAFLGTPQQYAQILSASYDAIHRINTNARVALGGLMNIASHAWMDAMLATPGTDAIHKFDIANIHVRTPNPADTGPVVRSWRRYFATNGFHGALWVTETGYPADPAWQTQPGYQGGPTAQARWMTTAIGHMLNAGAAIVFITERDAMTGRYASEGVLQSSDPLTANPAYARRPSFYAARTLAHRNRRNLPIRDPPVRRNAAPTATLPHLSERTLASTETCSCHVSRICP
jgi:hypothetical protein